MARKARKRRRESIDRWATRGAWLFGAMGALAAVALVGSWWLWGGRSGDQAPGGTGSIALNAELVALGRGVYEAQCATCHGVGGEGMPGWQKQNPDGTFPAPPHDATGHTWHHADGTLYKIVRGGGQIFEDTGFKSTMPSFGELLDPEEIRGVITYLKTFWGPREQAYQAQQSLGDPSP